MDFKQTKEKWQKYEEAKQQFAESHNPIVCAHCERDIKPGDDIVVCDGYAYCDWECFGLSQDACSLIFNENDEDYYSWFPEK